MLHKLLTCKVVGLQATWPWGYDDYIRVIGGYIGAMEAIGYKLWVFNFQFSGLRFVFLGLEFYFLGFSF